MILSGHQPVYLPSILLFTKIALSDAFMFVGHCQASPGTWHNRNQIRGARLTIPIKNEFGQSISETRFDGDHWRRKHVRSIELAYSKRPFFDDYFSELAAEIMEPQWDTLALLNNAIICKLLDWLEISRAPDHAYPTMLEFSGPHITGHKTDMLISMCKAVGANEYLSNEGARDYVDEQKMADAGIKHRWLKFEHPIYDQGHPEFLSNLSAIDLLFNCGPEAANIVKGAGSVD